MGWTKRRMRRWSTAARFMLLATVLVGLLGMHVLTAEDANSGHGALPMINVANGLTGHDPMSTVALPRDVVTHEVAGHTNAVATPDAAPSAMNAASVVGRAVVVPGVPGSDGEQAAMAGCILFLAIGGAALILVLLHRRNSSDSANFGRLPAAALTDMRRRGPPGRWPRLALCVIRV